jgi:hypothetical protein
MQNLPALLFHSFVDYVGDARNQWGVCLVYKESTLMEFTFDSRTGCEHVGHNESIKLCRRRTENMRLH